MSIDDVADDQQRCTLPTMSTTTITPLQLVEGFVWCDKHGEVHCDTLNPYGYIEGQDLCTPDDHRLLYMEPDMVIESVATAAPAWSRPKDRRKLTSHQREVYECILRMSKRLAGGVRSYRWVDAKNVGSKNACDRLIEKGWIEMEIEYGPRGGELRSYRPIIDKEES